jgi:hypothetical protein
MRIGCFYNRRQFHITRPQRDYMEERNEETASYINGVGVLLMLT